MIDPTIYALKQQRQKALSHYRRQKIRYTADIDQAISERLLEMQMFGCKTSELQEFLGSKDYNTLRYYLDFEHPGLPQQPLALTAPPAPNPAQPHIEPTHPDKVTPAAKLKDFLTVDVENRRITLTDVPYSAWSERTLNRPDLYPLDPTDEEKYSGWANVTSSFLIGERSEAKSPFISENKEGGQLTKSVLKQLLGAE